MLSLARQRKQREKKSNFHFKKYPRPFTTECPLSGMNKYRFGIGSKKRCLLAELSVYEDVRLRRVDCIECVWHIHHHIDLFTNVSTVSNTKLSETSVQVILTSLSISCCFVLFF